MMEMKMALSEADHEAHYLIGVLMFHMQSALHTLESFDQIIFEKNRTRAIGTALEHLRAAEKAKQEYERKATARREELARITDASLIAAGILPRTSDDQ